MSLVKKEIKLQNQYPSIFKEDNHALDFAKLTSTQAMVAMGYGDNWKGFPFSHLTFEVMATDFQEWKRCIFLINGYNHFDHATINTFFNTELAGMEDKFRYLVGRASSPCLEILLNSYPATELPAARERLEYVLGRIQKYNKIKADWINPKYNEEGELTSIYLWWD